MLLYLALAARFLVEGTVEPPCRAAVTLYAVQSPFSVSVMSDDRGRFRFREVEAGAYTLIGFCPGRAEARKTIEVGPGTVTGGIVRVALALGGEEPGQNAKVSARSLGISEKAKSAYRDAQRKLAKNDINGARRDLLRAVERSPQFAEAWNNLGTMSYQTREYEQAAQYFRSALKAEPGLYEAMVNLGGVLLTLGQFDEALDYNLYSMLERPGDALANSQLGMNYWALGNAGLAIKYLKEAKRLDAAHFSHPQLLLGEIYLKQGKAMEARAELEEFLRLHPDAPQAARIREILDKLSR